MAIGKISGAMLFDNLERLGSDLRLDTDLVYFDVNNRRLGINNTNPQYSFDNRGNVRFANLIVTGNRITSETGKIDFGSNANVRITGGTTYDVLYTDGSGNLAWGTLSEISSMDNFTGNTIDLGTNTLGSLTNAVSLTTETSVTNAIALINQLLGNITDPTGQTIHVVTANAASFFGQVKTNAQPFINSLGTITSDLTINANLIVNGNTSIHGVSDLSIQDNMINLHTLANLAPWTFDDGKDIGFKFHYYDTQDEVAFLGRANDTGYLEWYDSGYETSGGTFFGNTYGTIKAGAMWLANTTASTDSTTGALRIAGGVGIGGNLNVAGNSTVGNITTNNITTNTVTILTGNIGSITGNGATFGNITIANTSISSPQVITFYSGESAIKLPTGANTARPTSPTGGEIRYNTGSSIVEYYNGISWVSVTPAITGQNFFADGITNVYTLDQTATTKGVLVSINGTLQEPDIAYTVSGTTLTFTEIPEASDRIDVRFLVTSVITNQAEAVVDSLPLTVGTSPTTIDVWDMSVYRGAKYTITSSNPFDQQMAEVMVMHNGINSFVNATTLKTGTNAVNFTTAVSTGNVILQATGTTANNVVRLQRTYFVI